MMRWLLGRRAQASDIHRSGLPSVNRDSNDKNRNISQWSDALGESTRSAQVIDTVDGAYGLKVLVEGLNPSVDVVAVHGLNGHREKTWTADNGKLWLRDLLPSRLSRARILTYGYDSRTRSSEPLTHQTLYGHATNFASALASYREATETIRRPIIFVAHSLGGLLVKGALIYSDAARKGHREHLKSIKLSTYGILFLATPHQGGNGVSFGKFLLRVASPAMNTSDRALKHLGKESEWLEMQLDQYNAISKDFDTKFFYEAYPTPLPIGAMMIVPKTSAIIPGATDAEAIEIRKHHRNMTRYPAEDDDDFKTVANHICLMSRKANSKVAANWTEWANAPMLDVDVDEFKIPFKMVFRRNNNFTGREAILAETHLRLCQGRLGPPGHTAVIYGTGGIGKSQIAIEYAFRRSDCYSAIFWINAQDPRSTQNSFVSLAQRLVDHQSHILRGETPNYPLIARRLLLTGLIDETGILQVEANRIDRVVDVVKQWLTRKGNDNWLLIFDNVDDLDSFDIRNYFPADTSGSILMTSRRPECARYGVAIPLDQMPENEALMLLSKSVSREISPQDNEEFQEAQRLVSRLGYLPLAIDQAGAYINKLSKPLASYLPLFDKDAKDVMKRKPPAAVWQYRDDTVFTTWEVSYKAVETESPKAAELLLLCAFLDNQFISESLLVHYADEKLVADAFATLLSFSLVRRMSLTEGFSIHPLIHTWARERLEYDQKKDFARRALHLLQPPTKEYEGVPMSYSQGIMVVPHASQLSRLARTLFLADCAVFNAEDARDFCRFGFLHLRLGQYNEATEWLHRGLSNEDLLPKDAFDSFLIAAAHALGESYGQKGQYQLGLDWYQRAKSLRQKLYGPNHELTLNSLQGMASCCYGLGKFDQCIELEKKALWARMKPLGEGCLHLLDPAQEDETLECFDFALAERQKHYSEKLFERLDEVLLNVWESNEPRGHATSMEMYSCALADYEIQLGESAITTSMILEGIGLLYLARCQQQEALLWYKRKFSISVRLDGPESQPAVLGAAFIGDICLAISQCDDAIVWYKRALTNGEKLLGEEHIVMVRAVESIAQAYRDLHQHENAMTWYKRALAKRERRLETEGPGTLTILRSMADIYHDTNQYDDALSCYQRILQGLEKSRGKEDEEVLKVVRDIGVNFDMSGQPEVALEWFARALTGSERTRGEDDSFTLHILHCMAVCHVKQQKHHMAIALFEKKAASYRRTKEIDKRRQTLSDLAGLYFQECQYERSLECYAEAFNTYRSSSDDENTKVILGHLWSTALKSEMYATAIRCTIGFLEKIDPHNTDDVIPLATEAMQKIAKALLRKGHGDMAAACYEQPLLCRPNAVHSAYCDGCDPEEGLKPQIEGVRNVCKMCEDFDLCEKCFTSYQKDGAINGVCKGHDFLRVPRERTRLDDLWENANQDRDLWIKMGLTKLCQELSHNHLA